MIELFFCFLIRVQTIDGTARATADYMPLNKTKYTFQPGETYLTINVELVDDGIHELDETFDVTLGAYPERTRFPTHIVKEHCSTILILNNDKPTGKQTG